MYNYMETSTQLKLSLPDTILARETVVIAEGQQTVERGFRFLKDSSFRVAEVTIWINGEMYQKITNLNDKPAMIVKLPGAGLRKIL